MIVLGLGANLSSSFGDRFQNIDMAVSAIEGYGLQVQKKSSQYESLSFPNKKNPKFINIAIGVKTHLPPEDLASVLIFIEESLERKRGKKNDPRTCDIDIIDYNGKVFDFTYRDLTFSVPHSKITHRNFVLYPLQEIVPDWKHPKTNELIGTLIEKLPREDKNSILKVNKY